MRDITVLECIQKAQTKLNESPSAALGTDLVSVQLLAAANEARARMCQISKLPQDYYVGTFITRSELSQYPFTPQTTQLFTQTRGVDNTTITGATTSKRSAVGYDGTLRMDKITGSASTTTVVKSTLSLATAITSVISGSVWVKPDTSYPTLVTLTLKNGTGAIINTTTFTPSVLTRVAVSGYIEASIGQMLKLEVSYSDTGKSLFLDGWQLESSDYATEYMDNPSGAIAVRSVFTLSECLYGVCAYDAGSSDLFNRWYSQASTLLPNVPVGTALPSVGSVGLCNIINDKLVLKNVSNGTHVAYVAAKAPTVWTQGSDLIDIPAPDHFILIEGIAAYVKQAVYDIGSNAEADRLMKAFESNVLDLARRKYGSTGQETVAIYTPEFGR